MPLTSSCKMFVSIGYIILFSSCLLILFLTIGGFLWTCFSLWLHSRKKGKCSPNADWSETWRLGENKLHYCKSHVYETICFFNCSRSLIPGSFDSWPCMACLVRMRDDVLLLHNWDNSNIYSVHVHDFEFPWLWDELIVGTAISYYLYFDYSCWL